MINKASMSNTKLKRKVTSMKRSSTIQALMPLTSPDPVVPPPPPPAADALSTQTRRSSLDSAQDLLLTRQITRQLVVERLLGLIELPVIEPLLAVSEPEARQVKGASDENQQTALATHRAERALAILSLTCDLSKCDTASEWRQSALDVLEFLEPAAKSVLSTQSANLQAPASKI